MIKIVLTHLKVLVGHISISSSTNSFFMLVQVKKVMKKDESGKLKNPGGYLESWMLSQDMKVLVEEGLVNSIHKTLNVYEKMGHTKTSQCRGTRSSCHNMTKMMT